MLLGHLRHQLVKVSSHATFCSGSHNTPLMGSVVDCGPPANPADGQVDISNGTVFGSTAIYICDEGYILSGAQNHTCEADGVWSLSIPSCQSECVYISTCYSQQLLLISVLDCGFLTDPDNGQVDTSSGTTFGRTANYTCEIGYALSGSQSRTCKANRTWSPASPVCIGKYALPKIYRHSFPQLKIVDCRPLTNPENGQADTSAGTTFGSTAMYTCNTGYTLIGSQTRTCESDGMWSPASPECQGM